MQNKIFYFSAPCYPAGCRVIPQFCGIYQKLALMEAKHMAFVLLAVVAALVYAWDRRMYRRAKDVRTSWNCIRCGVQLNPMESTDIRVAGGPHVATTARACPDCARRDRRIWWSTMGVIALGFVATLLLLWWQ